MIAVVCPYCHYQTQIPPGWTAPSYQCPQCQAVVAISNGAIVPSHPSQQPMVPGYYFQSQPLQFPHPQQAVPARPRNDFDDDNDQPRSSRSQEINVNVTNSTSKPRSAFGAMFGGSMGCAFAALTVTALAIGAFLVLCTGCGNGCTAFIRKMPKPTDPEMVAKPIATSVAILGQNKRTETNLSPSLPAIANPNSSIENSTTPTTNRHLQQVLWDPQLTHLLFRQKSL